MGRRFCAQCGCEVVLQERSGVALIVVVLAMLLGYGALLALVDPSDSVKRAVTLLALGALYVWTATGKHLVDRKSVV